MDRQRSLRKIVRILSAGVLFAGISLCLQATAAELPRHPQPSQNAADRVWNKVRNERASAGNVQSNVPKQGTPSEVQQPANTMQPVAPVPPPNPTGYTEAEIREQMIRRHASPRPAFRRVSGAVAGADYRPGTMDVKIPVLFFPPDDVKDVSESFPVNPDGTLGIRNDGGLTQPGYSAAAQKQLQEERRRQREEKRQAGQPAVRHQASQARPASPAVQQGMSAYGGAAARSKTKIITVQVNVLSPSPFRPLAAGDFRWFTNNKGQYVVGLPGTMPNNPLQGLPADGPMVIRNASQSEFMAVTVDDPSDTYYYKNQDTFPNYGKAVPVYTETRKNIQGDEVAIKYIRYFLGGQYCLIVDSAAKRGGKTYRAAVIFPESKQYEYLPKALYAIENLKGM